MRMKKVWITVITVVIWIILCSPNTFAALGDEEAIKLLDEKFLRGEISEELYKKLSERYSGGKREGEKKQKAAVPSDSGLLKNGGFEGSADIEGVPEGWSTKWSGRPAGSCKFSLDKEVKHSGGQSFKYEILNWVSLHGGIAQTVKVKPGKRYTLTFWFKGENDFQGEGCFVIYGNWLDSSGNRIGKANVIGGFKEAPSEWKQVVLQTKWPAPGNADSLQVSFEVYLPKPGGIRWIDDVELVEETAVTPTLSTEPAAHNLLKNPSFEDGTSDPRYPVANWDPHEWTGTNIPTWKYKHDKSISHTGKASIYSECQPVTKTGAWAQYYKQADPSKTYHASVWLRGENLTEAVLIVDWGKVDGKRPWASVSGTFDWKKVIIEGIKLDPKHDQLIFTIINRGGKLWADDAVLKETGDVASITDPPQRYLPLQDIPDCPPEMPPNSLWNFFAGNYRNEGYVSPDMPTYFAIGQFSNLSKEQTPDPQHKLILDLPVEIEIIGRRFGGIPQGEEITRDGKSYKRYQMAGGWKAYGNCYGNNALVLATTMRPGEKTMVYFHGEWMHEGKLCTQPEQKLPVRAIHIEEAKPPEKMYICFSQFGSHHNIYGDLKPYRRLGINTVDGYGTAGDWKHFARMCQDADLSPETWAYLSRLQGLPPEARTVDINGNRLNGLCPSYRGEGLKPAIVRGKQLIDYGITLHTFDPERRDGEKICFCPRCIDAFRQFLKQEYSHLTWRDPHQFMKNKINNLEHYQAWIRFKAHQYALLHKYYKDQIQAYMKEKGILGQFKLVLLAVPIDARKGYEFSAGALEDPRELAMVFDYYSPMLYPAFAAQYGGLVDMLSFQEQVYTYYRYAKGVKDMQFTVTLETGFPWCGRSPLKAPDMPSPMIEAQMLECMVSGAKGLHIYSVGQFDALDMMYAVRAMKQITPLEDFFLKAKRTELVKDIENQTFVKGLEYQGNIVLLVSEYSARSRTAKVKVTIKKPADVIDMANGKTIAHLTPGKNVFEVKLKGDPLIDGRRARMFFVGDIKNIDF